MHPLRIKAQECAGGVLLTIFGFVAKLDKLDRILASLYLLDDFA